MKKLIVIFILLLIGCESITIKSSICPDIVEYTVEEQDKMKKLLENNDNSTLNKFMVDYFDLREKIRICKKWQK